LRRLQYDEVEGHEKFADDFQMAMTYYTKQSLMGGDVELQDAYDWRSAKARPCPARAGLCAMCCCCHRSQSVIPFQLLLLTRVAPAVHSITDC
jgi:hypothetical protein